MYSRQKSSSPPRYGTRSWGKQKVGRTAFASIGFRAIHPACRLKKHVQVTARDHQGRPLSRSLVDCHLPPRGGWDDGYHLAIASAGCERNGIAGCCDTAIRVEFFFFFRLHLFFFFLVALVFSPFSSSSSQTLLVLLRCETLSCFCRELQLPRCQPLSTVVFTAGVFQAIHPESKSSLLCFACLKTAKGVVVKLGESFPRQKCSQSLGPMTVSFLPPRSRYF